MQEIFSKDGMEKALLEFNENSINSTEIENP